MKLRRIAVVPALGLVALTLASCGDSSVSLSYVNGNNETVQNTIKATSTKEDVSSAIETIALATPKEENITSAKIKGSVDLEASATISEKSYTVKGSASVEAQMSLPENFATLTSEELIAGIGLYASGKVSATLPKEITQQTTDFSLDASASVYKDDQNIYADTHYKNSGTTTDTKVYTDATAALSKISNQEIGGIDFGDVTELATSDIKEIISNIFDIDEENFQTSYESHLDDIYEIIEKYNISISKVDDGDVYFTAKLTGDTLVDLGEEDSTYKVSSTDEISVTLGVNTKYLSFASFKVDASKAASVLSNRLNLNFEIKKAKAEVTVKYNSGKVKTLSDSDKKEYTYIPLLS